MDLTGKAMKSKHYLFILAVAAMAGCQNEKFQLQNNTANGLQFIGTTESYSPETRTALDSDMNVVWKQGDQLSIFVGKTLNQQFQVQNSCDGKIDGAFDPVSSPGFVSSTAIQNNVGYYPYSSTTTLQQDGQNYILSTTLPAQQTYAANSFGSGAFPMVAVTEDTYDTNLKFKNVLGGIKLQLKGTAKIKSIKISGNNNEILCGPATVTAAYGALPKIEMSTEGGKEVTLDCGTGVQLNSETATNFTIALPPMTFLQGFTVEIRDSEDKMMAVSTNKERSVNRSTIAKMAEISYKGNYVVDETRPLTFTSIGSSSICLKKSGKPEDVSIEVKINGADWRIYSVGENINMKDGEFVSFRSGADGNATFSSFDDDNNFNYYYFQQSGDGTLNVTGNVMSLVSQEMPTTIPSPYYFADLFANNYNMTFSVVLPATTLTTGCYYAMFDSCFSLTVAPELPAAVLADECYAYMFADCISLTEAPALHATALADYCCYGMFSGCTSLTAAPALPATTLTKRCYYSMFRGCTSLSSAPALPATTLAEYCYCGMFAGCTSLSLAPALPATTLVECCYYRMFKGCTLLSAAPALPATSLAECCYYGMFEGCTSLSTTPELSATSLAEACYSEMFSGCTSLKTASELPASTLSEYCCSNMFRGCTSLSSAPELHATNLAQACYLGMFSGCTSLKTAPNLPATTLAEDCYSRMFYGCTSLSTPPELPAVGVEVYCYELMFSGCTSLTKAPELPAASLAEFCYEGMFNGCTKLNYVKALFTTTPSDDYTENWLHGVSSTGTFVKSKDATWNVSGTNGIPSGWTVTIDGGPYNGHEYVDLGLSVKWATMNVGATKATDYGDYFAWGATEPWYEPGYAQSYSQSHWKTGRSAGYAWGNAPYQTDNATYYSSTKWTKYLGSTTSSYKNSSATDVNALKIVLDAKDDAATVNWGGGWRMPTKTELDELRNPNNCNWTWYDNDNPEFFGVAGYKVTSKKNGYSDKFIFLPAAGYWGDTYLCDICSCGDYWSSSLDTSHPYGACDLHFDSGCFCTYGNGRCVGQSVRPVCP